MILQNYFDHASASVPREDVLEVYSQSLVKEWANPSSTHFFGSSCYEKYQEMKQYIAKLLLEPSAELIHLSSVTEANSMILKSFLQSDSRKVLMPLDVHSSLSVYHEYYPERIEFLPLESNGRFSEEILKDYLRSKHFGLFVCSHVGHDLGSIYPVHEIAYQCKKNGVYFHIDGAQALGACELNLESIEYSSYTFSFYKSGGIRGSAILCIKDIPWISPLLLGGSQEWGLRASTENSSALIANGTCLKTIIQERESANKTLTILTDRLREKLSTISNIDLHPCENIKDGFVTFSNDKIPGNELVKLISNDGFCIASGSACSEKSKKASPVSKAIYSGEENKQFGFIRISCGVQNTVDSVDELCEALNRHLC